MELPLNHNPRSCKEHLSSLKHINLSPPPGYLLRPHPVRRNWIKPESTPVDFWFCSKRFLYQNEACMPGSVAWIMWTLKHILYTHGSQSQWLLMALQFSWLIMHLFYLHMSLFHVVFWCMLVNCGLPDVDFNGVVYGNDWWVGSMVRDECRPGFILVGEPTRTCQSNGKWTAKPSCLSEYTSH